MSSLLKLWMLLLGLSSSFHWFFKLPLHYQRSQTVTFFPKETTCFSLVVGRRHIISSLKKTKNLPSQCMGGHCGSRRSPTGLGTTHGFSFKNKKPSKPRHGRFLWFEAGLNRRHMDFQSIALPTELSNPFRCSTIPIAIGRILNQLLETQM